MPRWIGNNAFTLGLAGVIAFSWLTREWGARDGFLNSPVTQPLAIILIFLVQGLALPTEEFRRSLARSGRHGLVQGWIFLGYPLLTLGWLAVAGRGLSPELRAGFLYLAILPTTISSAVYFTDIARGHVADSVFSSSLSNLLAVFLVPTGVSLLIFSEARIPIPLLPIFGKLCLFIALPLCIGQGLRLLLPRQLSRLRPWFRPATTASIFFIMYCAFCDGWSHAVWEKLGWKALALSFLHAAMLLGIVSFLAWWTSGLMGLEREGRIPLLFCASQKSLATGVPMASQIFPSEPGGALPALGVLLLPLICFHPLQLTLAACLADRLRGGR